MTFSRAEVQLPGSLSDACLAEALRSQPDVINFRKMPHQDQAWWFELADPDLTHNSLPAFLVRQRQAGGSWTVHISGSFDAGHAGKEALRQAVVERQQQILGNVVETCAGSIVRFDAPQPCGKGDEKSICVEGRPRPPPPRRSPAPDAPPMR